MNIRVDLNYPIKDGTEVVFRSPVDCSQITGLKVYYLEDGITTYREFAFADAHGNNVGDIDHLFAENVVVKVILDVTTSMAFVQNADTNAYLEGRFDGIIDKLCPSFTESGAAVRCEPGEGYPLEVISNINPKESSDTWGEIKLYHSGKNLAPNVSRTLNKTGITIEFIDNILKINGTGGRNLGGYNADYAFTLPAGTYTWSLTRVSGTCTYSGSSGTFYLRTSTGYVSVSDMYGGAGRKGTFTLTEPTILCLDVTTAGSSTYENLTFTFQVEAGDTATAFEPYKGTTVYTADFSNYGLLDAGSYNWTTGVLINEAGNHYQHDLETNTFEMVDETEHIPRRVRNIHAYPGVNTLISDCGDTAVSGKADPVAIIEKLTNAIIALGGNV